MRARLLALGDAGGIEGAANDLVADTGKILDAAAADEDDGVLLEVVTLARDVGGDLHAVGEPDASDLAERRVRLLGGRGVDAGADATRCGAAIRALRPCPDFRPGVATFLRGALRPLRMSWFVVGTARNGSGTTAMVASGG